MAAAALPAQNNLCSYKLKFAAERENNGWKLRR